MTIVEGFGYVADMLAQMIPNQIITLKAPKAMSERVEVLVNLKKDGLITLDESSELERFRALDLFISLAKARAKILLAAWGQRFQKQLDLLFEAHFGQIVAKTRIGRASVKLFRFNDPDILILRQILAQAGQYPNT